MQVIINGDNANTATTVIGYAANILDTVGAATERHVAAVRPADRSSRASGTTRAASTLFLVPGPDRLHRDDHRGRLDRALDRPREGARHDGAGADGADRHALVHVGKTIPYFVISLASAALIVLAAMVLFGLPMRGNWWLCCWSRCRCSWSARSAPGC